MQQSDVSQTNPLQDEADAVKKGSTAHSDNLKYSYKKGFVFLTVTAWFYEFLFFLN